MASNWNGVPNNYSGNEGVAFDHYDQYGQPVDVNGNVMTGSQDGWAGGNGFTPATPDPTTPSTLPTYGGMSQADFLAAYKAAVASGMSEEDAINQVKAQNGGNLAGGDKAGWGSYGPGANNAPPVNNLPDVPLAANVTAPSTVTSGNSSYDGSSFGPWSGHFQAPTPRGLPDVPTFDARTIPDAPTFTGPAFKQAPDFTYEDFQGPTMEEAANSPGYKFRVGAGTDALQNWAAARGTLNDSGTAKALEDYGQNAASQEYSNVFKRKYDTYTTNRANAADAYRTNYQTQYIDPYVYNYQAAKDAFAPQMATWQARVTPTTNAAMLGYSTDAANIQHLNDVDNTNAYNDYYLGWQDYENRRQQGVNFALGS
jgi:hypothetical protein